MSHEPLLVEIGNRVPVEIAQAVIKAISGSERLFVKVTVMKEDTIVEGNRRFFHGFTQHVYIGSLSKNKGKPLSEEKMNALLKEGITHEEFMNVLLNSR